MAARASAWIMIFLLCMNASATVMSTSGVAADWGVEPSFDAGEHPDDIERQARNFGANTGEASFLIGLVTSVGTTLSGLTGFIFAAPEMFQNLGVPSWITALIFAPMYAIVFFDLVYMFTGRSF